MNAQKCTERLHNCTELLHTLDILLADKDSSFYKSPYVIIIKDNIRKEIYRLEELLYNQELEGDDNIGGVV